MAIPPSNDQQCDLLSTLSPSGEEQVKQGAVALSFAPQRIIFEHTDPCQIVPILSDGQIRVFFKSESGRELTLYRVNPNEICILTLSCLLSGDVYPAFGVAENEVKGIGLPRELFLNLVATEPSFREQAFHSFAGRISELMQLVDEVTFKRLDSRLAQILLQKGPVIVASHQDLADELGSVREIISRLLKQFAENGWILLSRRQIQVINTKQLEHYAKI